MVDYLSDHVLRADADVLTVTPLYTSAETEERGDENHYVRAPAVSLTRVNFEGTLTKASVGAAVAYAEVLHGLKALAETVYLRCSLGNYFVDLGEVYVRVLESPPGVRFGVAFTVVGSTLTHVRAFEETGVGTVTSDWGI